MDCELRHWLVTQSFRFLTESLRDNSILLGKEINIKCTMYSNIVKSSLYFCIYDVSDKRPLGRIYIGGEQ